MNPSDTFIEVPMPGILEQLVFRFFYVLPFFIFVVIIGILIKIILSKTAKQTSKIVAGCLLIALVSSSFVFATLSFPKTIVTTYSIDPLNNILCGWPIPFIQFDSPANPPQVRTIDCIAWAGSPMDTKIEFLWIPFLTNVAITFGVIWAGVYLLWMLFKVKKDVKNNTHEKNNDKPN